VRVRQFVCETCELSEQEKFDQIAGFLQIYERIATHFNYSSLCKLLRYTRKRYHAYGRERSFGIQFTKFEHPQMTIYF